MWFGSNFYFPEQWLSDTHLQTQTLWFCMQNLPGCFLTYFRTFLYYNAKSLMFSWACKEQNVILFYSEQFLNPPGNTWMQKTSWIINGCWSPERQRWAAAQRLGSESMVGKNPLSPGGRKLWFLVNAVLFPSPWEHNKWLCKYIYFIAFRSDGYAYILP